VIIGALASLVACGRLGFDELGSASLTSELRVVAGATSIDAEVCASRPPRIRTAVSTTPWPVNWDAT